MKSKVSPLMLLVFLIGCTAITGEEVARLPVNRISTEGDLVVKETTLNLKKDDEIAIWSDMDIEYEGEVALRFKMEVLKNGVKMGELEIDPTAKNITLGEIKTSFNDQTDWSFSGKNSEIIIEEDASYTFKALLVASENPSLKVTKAEIVLKK